MKKEQYKKISAIKRIRTKFPGHSLRSANATIKILKALGPLTQKSRERILKACHILVNYEDDK